MILTYCNYLLLFKSIIQYLEDPMGRLTNKHVLITGGGSGIGRTTAKVLSDEGAKVVVSDINIDAVTQTAEDIGNSVIAIKHDVTDDESWKDGATSGLNNGVTVVEGDSRQPRNMEPQYQYEEDRLAVETD